MGVGEWVEVSFSHLDPGTFLWPLFPLVGLVSFFLL